MPRGKVLVIEDDEWVGRLLVKFLSDAGYDVELAGEAREGFEKAKATLPDCILCDVGLPDVDGYWVARRVRMEPSRLATTPFLFLTSLDEPEARLQGFNVGADAYLTKPFRHEEVVAQVGALIAMAERLREQRDSFVSIAPAAHKPALRGDLAQMSIATVLTLLEMERRSGVLEIVSDGAGRAELHVVDGALAASLLDERRAEPVDALRAALAWSKGRFWFRPSDVIATPAQAQPLSALLLEAMRLEDEAKRG